MNLIVNDYGAEYFNYPIPSSGIVVPGQICDVHVFFKSYELGGGTYDGVLNVYHNVINQQSYPTTQTQSSINDFFLL